MVWTLGEMSGTDEEKRSETWRGTSGHRRSPTIEGVMYVEDYSGRITGLCSVRY